jgi:hypothetical protein
LEPQAATRGTIAMRMIRAGIFVLVALLVLIILVVVAIGAFLPQQHISSCAAQFHQPPDAIWQAITDYAKFPTWREDVTRVQMLPPVNGKPSWREFDNHGGSIPYQVMKSRPRRTVARCCALPRLAKSIIRYFVLPRGSCWAIRGRSSNIFGLWARSSASP